MSRKRLLTGFLNANESIKGGADDITLLSHTDLSGHQRGDFIPAHHQHPATAQLLTRDILEFPLLIGVFHRKVLCIAELWTDWDISELVHLAAIAFQLARCGLGGTDIEIQDGNNHNQLKKGLTASHPQFPTCIIANTVKGKGVSFMENNLLWHYRDPQGQDYINALKELGAEDYA